MPVLCEFSRTILRVCSVSFSLRTRSLTYSTFFSAALCAVT